MSFGDEINKLIVRKKKAIAPLVNVLKDLEVRISKLEQTQGQLVEDVDNLKREVPTENAPVIDSVTYLDGDYTINFSLPTNSIEPDGGYDTIINDVDQNDNANYTGFSRTITGLDASIEQRFMLESRYTVSGNFPRSNEFIVAPQFAEVLAFPSALGAGANATGGRGLNVYHVTNLNNSGAGSFRDAVSVGNRTILFDVSGTINLTTDLYITVDNLTIAGQSAPQGGISITGASLYMQDNNNVIMRYVRVRPNYNSSGSVDAFQVYNTTNFIGDHLSVSWGGDEAMSVTGTSDTVTVQNSILGESATGMLIGNNNYTVVDTEFSVLNNLFYNISHRFPNVNSKRADVINNVVHNWNSRLKVVAARDGVHLNDINNHYQKGVRTESPTAILQSLNWFDLGSASNRPNIRIYTNGNAYPTFRNFDDDNWDLWVYRFNITSGAYAGGTQGGSPSLDFRVLTPFTQVGKTFTPKTESEALTDAQNLGANKYLNADGTFGTTKDSIDTIYLDHVQNNTSVTYAYPPTDITTKQWYIDYQNAISSTPINTRPAGFYVSDPNIPETWFLANVPSGKGYNDVAPNGYTYLENYINNVG